MVRMKKSERTAKAGEQAATAEKYSRQETAMRSFVDLCRECMNTEQWNRYYPEAERSAGETFHIVRDLVYALKVTQVPIEPKLRRSLDAVILECGLDRNRWSDLRNLNYDEYWKSQYGYNDAVRPSAGDSFNPHSPTEPSG